MIRRQLALLLGCLAFLRLPAADLASLPPEPVWAADAPDWLVTPTPYQAGVWKSADGRELVVTHHWGE